MMHVRLGAWIGVLSWTIALAVSSFPASAKRVALVIGNSEYEHVSNLPNPVNDAQDIAAALSRIGFEVTEGRNLDYRDMRLAIRDFSETAEGADMVVIYFAGHGIEIDNTNFLIPVNAELRSDSDVEFEAIRLDAVVNAVSGVDGLKVILVDACRNNPFLSDIIRTTATRSIGRGLSRIDPGGVLVGYAARGGTLALDGDGRNSPYAEALLRHIEEPGLELGKMFRKVRDTVYDLTGGYQEPFTYGSLPGRDIFLVPAAVPVVPKGPTRAKILQEFVAADILGTEEAWSAFLNRYEGRISDATLLDRARQKLAGLAAPPGNDGTGPGSVQTARSDPLSRACDKLAADPDDPGRPGYVEGVASTDIDAAAAVAACKAATAGYPMSGRSHYQLFRALKVAGEIERAKDALTRARDLGYTTAAVIFAQDLLEGYLTDEEERYGLAILGREMDAGSAVAARLLGDFYKNRSWTKFKYPEADFMEYYRTASARGDTKATYELGYHLVTIPNKTVAERREGLELLERAAGEGYERAMLQLANFHLTKPVPGAGTKDPVDGLRWLEAVAEAGSIPAAVLLAKHYRSGQFLEVDEVAAARWTEVAAARGHARSMVANGFNWEVGRGRSYNPMAAASSYVSALQKGNRLPYRRLQSEWDRETARALQRLLAGIDASGYAGPIDGIVGPGTRRAMERLCGCSPAKADIRFADAL